MNYFTIRVELHGASWADYDTLHAAMTRAGFSRTVQDAIGINFETPTAEYRLAHQLWDVETVATQAESIASRVRPSASILVGQTAAIAFRNLPRQKPLNALAAVATMRR